MVGTILKATVSSESISAQSLKAVKTTEVAESAVFARGVVVLTANFDVPLVATQAYIRKVNCLLYDYTISIKG